MFKKVMMFLLVMLLVQSVVFAGAKKLNFQGMLATSDGTPITGTHTLYYNIYNVSSGGSSLWTGADAVTLGNDGLFSVTLQDGSPSLDTLPFDTQYYVGVSVDGDPEISPRQLLGASGYALGSIGNFTIGGKVGVGTASPMKSLHTYTASDGFNIFQSGSNKWVFGEAGGACQVGGLYGYHSGITIDTSGKVGIGTASPSQILEVVKSGDSYTYLGTFLNPSTHVNALTEILVGRAIAGDACLVVGYKQSANYGYLGVAGDSDALVIANDGKIGIGTASPMKSLHTYTATDGFNIFQSGGNKWVFGEAGGLCQISGLYGVHPGIRIDTSGRVGIADAPNPSYTLIVNGPTYCPTGVWTASDINLKTEIQDYSNSSIIGKVINLKTIKYKLDKNKFQRSALVYGADKTKIQEQDLSFCDKQQIGLSAQELEKVFPELVNTDTEGRKAVDYGRLSVILLEAMKEQQKKIETLESQVKTLMAK